MTHELLPLFIIMSKQLFQNYACRQQSRQKQDWTEAPNSVSNVFHSRGHNAVSRMTPIGVFISFSSHLIIIYSIITRFVSDLNSLQTSFCFLQVRLAKLFFVLKSQYFISLYRIEILISISLGYQYDKYSSTLFK